MKNLTIVPFALCALFSGDALASSAPEPTDGGEAAVVAQLDYEPGTDVDMLDDVDTEEGDAKKFELPVDLSFGAFYAHGAGGFRRALSDFERPPRHSLAFDFGVAREIVDGFSARIGWGFYKYVSSGGGLNERYEARIYDINARLDYAPIVVIPVVGISVSGNLTGVVPVSRISRFQTLRTGITPGLTFARSFSNLTLSYGLSATKRFHEQSNFVVVGDAAPPRRDGEAEAIAADQTAVEGRNTEWSVGHNVVLSYRWFPGFTTSLAWGFASSWTYVLPDRDDAPVDVTEDPAFGPREGRVPRQVMTGSITAGYSFLDHFNVTLAAATSQLPKTADNQRVRFPFWDTQTANLAATQIQFGLGVSY